MSKNWSPSDVRRMFCPVKDCNYKATLVHPEIDLALCTRHYKRIVRVPTR